MAVGVGVAGLAGKVLIEPAAQERVVQVVVVDQVLQGIPEVQEIPEIPVAQRQRPHLIVA